MALDLRTRAHDVLDAIRLQVAQDPSDSGRALLALSHVVADLTDELAGLPHTAPAGPAAPPPAPAGPILNPDCRDGKHQACNSDAWDPHPRRRTRTVSCDCTCHSTATPALQARPSQETHHVQTPRPEQRNVPGPSGS